MVFSIAEIGLNHNGDIDHAKRLIDSAADAGFSSVKFQNFKADEVYCDRSSAGTYRLMGQMIGIYDLHLSLEMKADFFRECKAYAEYRGVTFFSTPTGSSGLLDLLQIDCRLLKLSSYQLTNIPFLREAAETKVPLIISTGGATLAEVAKAVEIVSSYHDNFQLLHCVIQYPAALDCANLQCIKSLRDVLGVPVGFSNNGFISDHGSIDYEAIPYHVGLVGGTAYEVHITLDRQGSGVDQGFSIEPHEQKVTLERLREGQCDRENGSEKIDQRILGSGVKRILPEEKYVRSFAFAKLFYSRDLKKGHPLSHQDVKIVRPGELGVRPDLIDPSALPLLLGVPIQVDVQASAPVLQADFNLSGAY